MKIFLTFASFVGGLVLLGAQNPPPPAGPPASQTDVNIAIQGDIGQPLHYAVPDFVPLTQDAIGDLAGASRPTTNRVLRRLEADGVVALHRGSIEVLDRGALARRAAP